MNVPKKARHAPVEVSSHRLPHWHLDRRAEALYSCMVPMQASMEEALFFHGSTIEVLWISPWKTHESIMEACESTWNHRDRPR